MKQGNKTLQQRVEKIVYKACYDSTGYASNISDETDKATQAIMSEIEATLPGERFDELGYDPNFKIGYNACRKDILDNMGLE